VLHIRSSECVVAVPQLNYLVALRVRDQGLGCGVRGLGLMVPGSGLRLEGSGLNRV